MRIIFKSHGLKINTDFKNYAEKKIIKIKSFITEPTICEVNFSCRPRGNKSKIVKLVLTLPSYKKPIHSETCAEDFFSAIDLATENLKTQILKTKDKKKKPRFPVKYWAERVVQLGMTGSKWLIRKTKRNKE